MGSKLGKELAQRDVFVRRPGKLAALIANQWTWAEDNSNPGAGDIRVQARRLALRVLWAGCWTDTTTRAAALAVVSVVVERGAYSFDRSVRFLAAETGVVDVKTISKARKTLAELGLIEVDGRGLPSAHPGVNPNGGQEGEKPYKQTTAVIYL